MTKTGLSRGVHATHLILTICTAGVWGIVWLFHWLATRRKTVTTTR